MEDRHGYPGVDARPPEGVDPEAFRVFHAFMRAMHLHRQLMSRAVQNGSSLGNAGMLRLIGAHEGISQRDLAEKLHLARPTVTGMLQAMEKSGAIERRPDEKDQRLTRVYLTREGRAQSERLRGALAEFVNETIGGIPPEEREHLGELLDKLSDNTAKALERVPGAPTDTTGEKTD